MQLGDGIDYTIPPSFACLKISKIKGETKQKGCLKDVDNIANIMSKQPFAVYRKDGNVLQKEEELIFNS